MCVAFIISHYEQLVQVKKANFIYLIDLINPYLPDATGTSKEDEWAYEGGRTRFSLVAADGTRSPLSVAYRIVVQIFHINVRVELDAFASIWVAPQD